MGDSRKQENRKQQGAKKTGFFAWSVGKKAGVIAGILIAVYAAIALFFQYHYFPGTQINGYSCGWRSVGKTKEIIRTSVKDYTIKITERKGRKEKVSSAQTGLAFVDDGKLENIKKEQKPYAWITFPFIEKKYENGITFQVKEKKYKDTFNQLDALNKELIEAPVDAWSKYDKTKNAYVIVEEIYGNTVKKDKFYRLLKEAMLRQDKTIDLEKAGCYDNPAYTKDSSEVVKSNEILNKYVSTDIVYDFEDRSQELKGNTIHKWLKVNKNYQVKIDREKVKKYIAKMADKFDTVGIERNFTSIAGNDVHVEGGTYGWKIDQEAETDKLVQLIKKGKQGKRKPEYEHIAKSRKKFDLGNTYVEVDLGSQYMWFYKNGKTLVSTPVVTGDTSKGRSTPTGVYYILYKTTNYTLTGENYASDVDYWLPFTHSGVGIHDASWRSSFGGGIYTYNGSHGCVNTPYNAVKTIYNHIESTYPVVVHW